MKEITILYDLPIILTKDENFVKGIPNIRKGDIILLPQDAILVTEREITGEPTPH